MTALAVLSTDLITGGITRIFFLGRFSMIPIPISLNICNNHIFEIADAIST